MPEHQRLVYLRDTTLREGIQIPGTRISNDNKYRFVSLLEESGIPEIEIGLPEGMSACTDLAAYIQRRGYRIKATALVPCYISDWKLQVDLAVDHDISRIDVLAPISDHLLQDPSHYSTTEGEIAARLAEVIEYAQIADLELGVGLIDSCRAPRDRVLDIIHPMESMGVSRLIIYDSVGTMLPSQMAMFIREVRKVSGLEILVHAHNDYGLATANAVAAVEAGASAVDCAINGIGGRAGNTSLEEICLILETLCGITTGVKTHRLLEVSRFVEEMTSLAVSPLKPIVGRFCFAHVPVMHIRCIAGGNPSAFEPFDPNRVGVERTYSFDLPVNYKVALEPFAQNAGLLLQDADLPDLIAFLRERSGSGGLTEQEILTYLRQWKGRGDYASSL